MSNQDCNCEQSERLKKELKQTKAERDNAEETWNNERKMYQAACVERDEARGVAVEMAEIFKVLVYGMNTGRTQVQHDEWIADEQAAEVIANWGQK